MKTLVNLPPVNNSELLHNEYVQQISGKSGRDRLQMMFSLHNKHLSPELKFVKYGTYYAAIVGFVVGGHNYYQQGKEGFKRINAQTQFFSIADAKRKMYDYSIVNAAKGGYKLAWRTGLFTGSYLCGVITIATYRNKFGILEHICSASLAGFLYRCHLGLRGSFAGAMLGIMFGGVSGLASLLLLRLGGVTLPELRAHWYKQNEELMVVPRVTTYDKLQKIFEYYVKKSDDC